MYLCVLLHHAYSYAKSVPKHLAGKRLTNLHNPTRSCADTTDRMTILPALLASRLEQKYRESSS